MPPKRTRRDIKQGHRLEPGDTYRYTTTTICVLMSLFQKVINCMSRLKTMVGSRRLIFCMQLAKPLFYGYHVFIKKQSLTP